MQLAHHPTLPDFWITPVKSGLNTIPLPLGMFRVNPRATLGRIIFTILMEKFEKLGKSLGFSGKICQREVPRANYPREPCGFSIVYNKLVIC